MTTSKLLMNKSSVDYFTQLLSPYRAAGAVVVIILLGQKLYIRVNLDERIILRDRNLATGGRQGPTTPDGEKEGQPRAGGFDKCALRRRWESIMAARENNATHAKHVKQESRLVFGKSVIDKAMRAGVSAVLIAPSVFVGVGSAHAVEGTQDYVAPDQPVVQVEAAPSAPQTASDALDNLAMAEERAGAREAEYAAASREASVAAAQVAEADRNLEEANARKAEAEEALRRAEREAATATPEDIAQAEATLEDAEASHANAVEVASELKNEFEAAGIARSSAEGRRVEAAEAVRNAEEALSGSSAAVVAAEERLASSEERLAELEAQTEEERRIAAESAYADAQSRLEAAVASVAEAESAKARALTMYESALLALDGASQSVAAAMDAQLSARGSLEGARSTAEARARELDNATSAKAQADADAESAGQALAAAQTAKAAADADAAAAVAAKAEAEGRLVQAKADEAAAKAAAEQAEATLAAGIYGFLECIGCTEGIAAIDNCRYAGLNDVGIAKDATGLQSLKAVAAYVRTCNELRAANGLGQLKISPVLLAMAAADANFSDTEIDHAMQFPVAENVAWNYGSDPFKQWYDEEKADYERTGDRSEAGHYFNIINPNYTTTGFAVCYKGTTNRWRTYAQVFSSATKYAANAMTVDEFEEAVNGFIAAQENAPAVYKNAVAATSAAEKDVLAATAAADAAQGKSATAAESLRRAEILSNDARYLSNIGQMRVESAQEDYASATAALASASAELEEVCALLAEAQAYEGACADAALAAETAYNDAASALEAAKEAAVSAESNTASARYALEHVEDAVEDARVAVADARAVLENTQTTELASRIALEEAQQALANAEGDFAAAQSAFALASAAYDEASRAEAAAAEIVSTAESHVAALRGAAEALSTARKAFVLASDQAVLALDARSAAVDEFSLAQLVLEESRKALADSKAGMLLAQMELERFALQSTTSNNTVLPGANVISDQEAADIESSRPGIMLPPNELIEIVDSNQNPAAANILDAQIVDTATLTADMRNGVAGLLGSNGADTVPFDPLVPGIAVGILGIAALPSFMAARANGKADVARGR